MISIIIGMTTTGLFWIAIAIPYWICTGKMWPLLAKILDYTFDLDE